MQINPHKIFAIWVCGIFVTSQPEHKAQVLKSISFGTTNQFFCPFQCGEIEARLTKIKSGSNAVTPEESAQINKAHQDTVRQWRKRKRMVRFR